jgi:hypothetical protein
MSHPSDPPPRARGPGRSSAVGCGRVCLPPTRPARGAAQPTGPGKLPFPPVKRATPTPCPTDQRDRDLSFLLPLRFFFLPRRGPRPCPLSSPSPPCLSLPSSSPYRNRRKRAGLNRALKSPHRAPSSLRLPHPDLDSS